jgi:hypothetical protein
MRPRFTRSVPTVSLLALVAIGLIGVVLSGCGDKPTPLSPVDVSLTPAPSGADELSLANPRVRSIMEVQNRHTASLMGKPQVLGTATGLTADGQLAILVLTEKPLGRGVLPAMLGGVPVVEEVTGPIRALDSGPAHRVKQTPPFSSEPRVDGATTSRTGIAAEARWARSC